MRMSQLNLRIHFYQIKCTSAVEAISANFPLVLQIRCSSNPIFTHPPHHFLRIMMGKVYSTLITNHRLQTTKKQPTKVNSC